MHFLTVELPSLGLAHRQLREPLKLIRIPAGIRPSRQLFQVLAHQLIDTGSQLLGPLPRLPNDVFINRKGEILLHSIRAHGFSVKLAT